ncbi:enoyl-CoA hydratase-related protein [Amycolatopsis acidiphila]|uniref:Enoyl-CoA hydratase n=1 Tax=Amycolatopsis acidiphila TaxID=715473 RepID=A0A558AKE6_9PSEU|nr:enoyl-CoA hydratase-related protein [Amycolatopsis acidiphila]TVT24735.1 enoyl-CoA hydratase [Amycolatopsis acidiphila]UIJ62702.1 enoyl-CoA hydratase-related protein [Amycolatopsis acidiphila]
MAAGLEFARDGEVGRLTFARPEKKNAITYDMWSAIPEVVAQVEADPALKVLVLTGAGDDFSAGADISEFGSLRSTAEGAAAYDKAVVGAVSALEAMRKPSVAMIRGNCIGGGCEISVACDFRFTAPEARFGITPAKLGIVYDFLSTRQLMSLIGPAHARYFLLSGQLIDASRAREIGLVNDVFGALEDDVAAFVATLCSRSQASIRGMNRIIGKILAGQAESDAEIDAIRSAAIHGEDYAEGVAAFLERRPPRFTYR